MFAVPHQWAWTVTLAAIVGIVVLSLTGHAVPTVLDVLAGGGIGAGAGLSIPAAATVRAEPPAHRH